MGTHEKQALKDLTKAYAKIAHDMQEQIFTGHVNREPPHVKKLNLMALYKQYENDPVARTLIQHVEYLYEERDWMTNQVAMTQRLREELDGYKREMMDMNAMHPKGLKWYDDPLKWANDVKTMRDKEEWKLDEDTKQRFREGDIRDEGDRGPSERHQGRSGGVVSSLLRRNRG